MKKARKTTTKTTTQSGSRRGSRLSRADMQTLSLLDQLVAEDRRIEQKYDLPFRSPRQVATSYQQCVHCRKDIALLIFGDSAKDLDGLQAYARLTNDLITQVALPAYIIAPPSDPNDLDSQALLLKVYPEQETPTQTTPTEWEALIVKLSDEHCAKARQSRENNETATSQE